MKHYIQGYFGIANVNFHIYVFSDNKLKSLNSNPCIRGQN